MKVVLAGDDSLLPELIQLVTDAGHDAAGFLLSDGEEKRAVMAKQAADAELAVECSPFEAAFVDPLESVLPPDRPYLASALTTSVTNAAYWTENPGRVVGWAALPPFVSPGGTGLVEVARGLQTEDWAFRAALDFWKSLGLEPVVVGDGPGLVRARVLCGLINEAVSALADGVASAEDIDAAMQLGNNYPKGLLAWADELGLNLVLSVLDGLHEETGDPAYRPHPLLKRKVWAGHLGRESGRGFFEYERPQ